ncbi:MAG: PDDEXK nuclease domain-containing protein [Thermodesulfovibrionales bacterium]|nr:PDDEXK nuclease domain-containing protein [Thermodesulfovibrionales bacterium]
MKHSKYTTLIKRLAEIIHSARTNAVRQINKTQVLAYYEIGREIVEFEQKGKPRAEYGEELIKRLSKDMTENFGRGFSEMNLRNMRRFYLEFPIQIQQTVSVKSLEKNKFQTVSGKSSIRQTLSAEFNPELSWSHYCELLSVENPLARSFYEKEAVNNNWSFRELKRQINSQLFERLALSKDSSAVMRLAKKGHLIETPEDAIKDPYVLEFLNLKEENVYTESRLEQAIIDNLQKFLLEMGKGFAFVARQKRITVGNRHYYVDLVFYNRILRCTVLIDLKIDELNHADIGQMNFYLNYFKENGKEAGENDPIGLILCAKKDEVFAKYVLGNLNNKIFASKYKLALPTEKELSRKIRSLHLLEGQNGT